MDLMIHRALTMGMSRKDAEAWAEEMKQRDRARRQVVESIPTFWCESLKSNVTVPEN